MSYFKKIKGLVLSVSFLLLTIVNANAQSSSSQVNSSIQRITYTIYGKVTDKVTKKPIKNALMEAKYGSASITTKTTDTGSYTIIINGKPKTFTLVVNANEYKSESKYVIVNPFTQKTEINFQLTDIVVPSLSIIKPLNGDIIFTNPTIEINFNDNGSGINLNSVKILINGVDYSNNITEKTTTKAICVITKEAPLPFTGGAIIYAEVKDLTGNLSNKKISVTVTKQIESLLQQGKQALLIQDLFTANESFAQAIRIEPNNAEANFYYALTSLGVIPQTNSNVLYFLKNIGCTNSNGDSLISSDLNPFNFNVLLPKGINQFDLSYTFPDGSTIQSMIKDVLIAGLDNSIKSLNVALASKNFESRVEIKNPMTGAESIEIDFADAAILEAMMYLVKGYLHTSLVHNMNVDLAELSYLFKNNNLTARFVSDKYPDLLRIADASSSVATKNALINSIDVYLAGYNSMMQETDDQDDDLLSIDNTGDYNEQAKYFANELIEMKKSLLGKPDSTFSVKLSQFANLGQTFDNPIDIRKIFDNDGLSYLFSSQFLPKVNYSLSNLNKADDNYSELLPTLNPFYSGVIKEVDFGDILALKTQLQSMNLLGNLLLGYNLKTDTENIIMDRLEGKPLNINQILSDYPELGNLASTENIALAKQSFSNIVDSYTQSVDYFRNHEDYNQTDDIFFPPDSFWAEEARYTQILNDVNSFGVAQIDPDKNVTGDEFHINLGELFINYKDARPFAPSFNDKNKVVKNSWPDLTFGGVLPDNQKK